MTMLSETTAASLIGRLRDRYLIVCSGENAETFIEKLREHPAVVEALGTLKLKPHRPKSCILVSAYDAEGKRVVTGSRSSEHPARDHHIGQTAIEFYYAMQRGVDITPEVLWNHVMGTDAKPIDMVLSCPNCGLQHVDAVVEPDWDAMPDAPTSETPPCEVADRIAALKAWEATGWFNPPHLCHKCGHTWRPADVATNGVKAVKTSGKADSPVGVTRIEPVTWTDEAKKTLDRLASFLQDIGAPWAMEWREWIDNAEKMIANERAFRPRGVLSVVPFAILEASTRKHGVIGWKISPPESDAALIFKDQARMPGIRAGSFVPEIGETIEYRQIFP